MGPWPTCDVAHAHERCRATDRATDSSAALNAIKAEGEGEWHVRKHGGAKRRLRRKIHIGDDEQTLEIRAIEATCSNVGDAPMLPELLTQIPADVEIGSITADGLQGIRPFGAETVHRIVSRPPLTTRKCHDAAADRGALAFGRSLGPMAFMPHSRRANTPSRGSLRLPVRAPVKKHCAPRNTFAVPSGESGADIIDRDRAETKMYYVKLTGQSLMARDFDARVAKLQVRAAVLNRYTALGIPVTEPSSHRLCPTIGNAEAVESYARKWVMGPAKAAYRGG